MKHCKSYITDSNLIISGKKDFTPYHVMVMKYSTMLLRKLYNWFPSTDFDIYNLECSKHPQTPLTKTGLSME